MPHVLFVIARSVDLVWIGVGDVKRSFAQLDHASPVPLELLGAVDGHPRKIRETFAPLRARGAWHRAAPEIFSFVEEHTIDIAPPVEAFLTVREAARRLGVSPITIRRRIEAGTLAYVRVGRQIRFDPKELA